MKAKLVFNLDNEQDEKRYYTAVRGSDAFSLLWDISQTIFRPARKHGYNDKKINEVLSKIKEEEGEELIGLLEEKFYELLEYYNININKGI